MGYFVCYAFNKEPIVGKIAPRLPQPKIRKLVQSIDFLNGMRYDRSCYIVCNLAVTEKAGLTMGIYDKIEK